MKEINVPLVYSPIYEGDKFYFSAINFEDELKTNLSSSGFKISELNRKIGNDFLSFELHYQSESFIIKLIVMIKPDGVSIIKEILTPSSGWEEVDSRNFKNQNLNQIDKFIN